MDVQPVKNRISASALIALMDTSMHWILLQVKWHVQAAFKIVWHAPLQQHVQNANRVTNWTVIIQNAYKNAMTHVWHAVKLIKQSVRHVMVEVSWAVHHVLLICRVIQLKLAQLVEKVTLWKLENVFNVKQETITVWDVPLQTLMFAQSAHLDIILTRAESVSSVHQNAKLAKMIRLVWAALMDITCQDLS